MSAETLEWRRMAEWFADDVAREYVCCAVDENRTHISSAALRYRMLQRAEEHARMSGETLTIWGEDGISRSSDARVIFCLLMALEARGCQ
jgi:hypothetical protein